MNLNLIFGGQFRPASGGQFQPALGGQFKSARGGQFHRFLHPTKNPNGKKTIAIDSNDLLPLASVVNSKGENDISETEMGALVINHGAGHTAGMQHVGDDTKIGEYGYTVSILMNDGKNLVKAIREYGYESITRDTSEDVQLIEATSDDKNTPEDESSLPRKTTLNPDFDTYMKASYGDKDSNPNKDLIIIQ